MRRILALTCILCLLLTGIPLISSLAQEDPLPMRYVTPGNYFPMQDEVLKAVNEKLQKDGVNIEVSIIRIPWDAYDQKLNLMLATGEPFELLHIMQDVKSLTTIASMGAILPIDEYLPKYDVLNKMLTPEEWEAGTYQNQIYAVPANWKDFSRLYGYMFARGDLIRDFMGDKYPVSADDLLEAFKVLQPEIEKDTGVKPFMWLHNNRHAPAFLHRTYDTWPFYVEMSQGLVLIRQDGSVESYYESEEFKKDCEFFKKLYDAGYIHPDILSVSHELKNDFAPLGAFLPSPTFNHTNEPELKRNKPDSWIQFFMLAPEKTKLIYTLAQNLNAISATSENPEAGLMFLNWLYSSKENHDLWHFGIEGKTYTASGEQRFKSIMDESNRPLWAFDRWMTGYLKFQRYDEDYPDAGIEYDTVPLPAEEVVYSPAAAFQFDGSELSMEIANLEAEMISSMFPLRFGLVSYEEGYDEAIQRMKAAGLDRYVEEFAKQFNEYLEAKK